MGHNINDMWLPAEMSYAKDARLPADLDAATRKTGERKRSVVPLMRNEEVIEYPAVQATLTERYTAEVVKFVKANKAGPFFVYLPHTMPHYPLHVSDRFKGKSAAGKFGDVIECIDWSVGQILQAVKDAGGDKKTLVVYTSDNGPAAGSAGPLKGKKGSTWEGGMREPCLMRWPGTIPAGSVCTELATIMDMLPTAAALAGATVPKDHVIDGKDIRPLLKGTPGAKSPYDAFFYHTSRGHLAAVRCGKWKLHLKPPDQRRRRKAPQPKPQPTGAQLYDLSADIGEKTNVAAQNPDVVKRLTAILQAFDKEMTANARPPRKGVSQLGGTRGSSRSGTGSLGGLEVHNQLEQCRGEKRRHRIVARGVPGDLRPGGLGKTLGAGRRDDLVATGGDYEDPARLQPRCVRHRLDRLEYLLELGRGPLAPLDLLPQCPDFPGRAGDDLVESAPGQDYRHASESPVDPAGQRRGEPPEAHPAQSDAVGVHLVARRQPPRRPANVGHGLDDHADGSLRVVTQFLQHRRVGRATRAVVGHLDQQRGYPGATEGLADPPRHAEPPVENVQNDHPRNAAGTRDGEVLAVHRVVSLDRRGDRGGKLQGVHLPPGRRVQRLHPPVERDALDVEPLEHPRDLAGRTRPRRSPHRHRHATRKPPLHFGPGRFRRRRRPYDGGLGARDPRGPGRQQQQPPRHYHCDVSDSLHAASFHRPGGTYAALASLSQAAHRLSTSPTAGCHGPRGLWAEGPLVVEDLLPDAVDGGAEFG